MAKLVSDSSGSSTGIIYQDVANAQAVNFNATSAQSATFPASTNLVRLCATAGCTYAIGSNPTATAGPGSNYLPPNWVEYIPVNRAPAATDKIAVIQSTVAGTLCLTPCHD